MLDWLFSRLLPVGAMAPDFELPDESGNPVRLSSFRGRSGVILVWYPADGTRICTRQLCELRDEWKPAGAAMFGINPQSADSHARFKSKHALPFPLLVDRGQRVGRLYGARGLIVRRTVYAIGADGRIRGAWRGTPSPAEVLATIQSG